MEGSVELRVFNPNDDLMETNTPAIASDTFFGRRSHRAADDAGAVRRVDLHFSGHRARVLVLVAALQPRLRGDRVVMWELWENGAAGTLSAYALGISAATVFLAAALYRTSRSYGLNV
jgi:hypothetical protein